jgi:uncharacterized iron-regulated membrane protein
MKASVFNRKIHRWAAVATALPVIIVIASGLVLQVKKSFSWIQPPTKRGVSQELVLSFDEILAAVSKIPEVNLQSWEDINRLDVRPGKGIIKVRGNNNMEVQLDSKTGDVLQIAVRRSDVIESIHDGSFFHSNLKLWMFLPSALLLVGVWATGIYLFLLPYLFRGKRKRKKW